MVAMLFRSLLSVVSLIAGVSAIPHEPSTPISSQTTCNGKTYTYNRLAGYGYVPSTARDKYGDTLGGYGSAIAIDQSTWKKTGWDSYSGILWAVPDRGWNTEGTLNYQNRIHKFEITLKLAPTATSSNPSPPNLNIEYLDTTLFTGPDFNPTTGLDAAVEGPYLEYPTFPDLPSVSYTGNGYGDFGFGGRRISIDSEGLALGSGGTFWVSDEYGPYIYQFTAWGQMIQAIRPPEAYIPRRNGSESFSADSPPIYDSDEIITPADTVSGRDNNQGFEGLTVSPDGKHLYALVQSALDQEGGPNNPYRRPARFIEYDISIPLKAKYLHSYVVDLPLTPSGKRVAAQSEVHYISNTQFMVLARDSGNGRGQGDINTTSNSESKYRHIDIFDISSATDVKSPVYDAPNGSIASSTGVINPNITAATYCSFLDFNNNTELARFGLHNGGLQNSTLLNEKWESIALVPVDPENALSKQFFLFSMSDNDFITQQGYMDFGRFTYRDSSGFDLDNQALVFEVTLP